jgi:hypothetical protein
MIGRPLTLPSPRRFGPCSRRGYRSHGPAAPNVMVAEDGRPKNFDFGLAKPAKPFAGDVTAAPRREDLSFPEPSVTSR